MLRFDELVVYPFPRVFSQMQRDSYIVQIVTTVMSVEFAVLISLGPSSAKEPTTQKTTKA